MQDLFEDLKKNLVETLNLMDVGLEDITLDTTFFQEGLGLDSIDILELVVMIEETYGVRIENRELGEQVFTTVGNLANYISSCRKDAQRE
jgi:acyl carrier protein